jgi:hypothetical protein
MGFWASVGRIAARFGPQALSFLSESKKQVPVLEDEVTVEVRGQPGSTKKQLYYLALSTAFGLIRRFDVSVGNVFLAAPPGVLMCEYDAADHWVRATVRFRTNLIASAATSVIESAAQNTFNILGGIVTYAIDAYLSDTQNRPLPIYSQAVVYSGPKEEVVGGPFNFTGAITPAVPTQKRSEGAPQLPFEGRVILTTAPSVREPNPYPAALGQTIPTPNPKPPGDNRSRGTFPVETASPSDPSLGLTFGDRDSLVRLLIPMVFASLTDSGNDQQFDYPTPGPRGE